MGVKISDIVPQRTISLDHLKGKTIAIDAMNSVYQFLSSIRQPDGTPLKDGKGNTTSHLSGLFYRTIRILSLGIKPIYVFDGKPPEIKGGEIERRREAKIKAQEKLEEATFMGDIRAMRKYAMRTSKFTEEMIGESKMLLGHMGVPVVCAPEEGEAQCAHMAKKGDAWAVASQDYDTLLLGAPRLVRNMTMSKEHEMTIVYLDEVLRAMNITREQLVEIAILVGTDFNEGVKNIGQKKALKIVKEKGLAEFSFDFDLDKVKNMFLNPLVTDEYGISWTQPDKEKVCELLCDAHDFSKERVKKALEEEAAALKEFSQVGLGRWF